ncbi:MAG: metallophosphoesterase [Clostridiales bacterium]|nr:metallophosphoesterase [Clostridiales bacterium]
MVKNTSLEKKRKARKIVLLAILVVIVGVVAYNLVSNYVDSLPKINYDYYAGQGQAAAYPDAGFAVISDLHFYDTSLGTEGAAFDEVLYSDRKLLLDSEALLDYAIDELLGAGLEFVLVSGDLTKDGELVNHERVAGKLQRLVDAGIKVFVVPGNHDVNNPLAVRFVGDGAEPVANISAEDFARIYGNMGYGGAFLRDSSSLSYAAEAVDGLWIVAVDSCRSDENVPGEEEVVGGRITQEQEEWLADVLGQAAEQGKAVIALTHHGLIEHWDGQSKLHPDYLVEDYLHVGEFLASYHVKLGFTGHYHAQDITRAEFGGNVLHDIETGSLVTAPCPIRYCDIRDGSLSVRTDTIVDRLYPGTDFAENAQEFVKNTVMLEARKTLKKYKASDADADYIADAVGDAFTAHYSGDEDAGLKPDFDTGELGLWGKIIFSTQKYVIEGLWEDLPPADNDVAIDL